MADIAPTTDLAIAPLAPLSSLRAACYNIGMNVAEIAAQIRERRAEIERASYRPT